MCYNADYEPNIECKQTARKLMNDVVWRTYLEKMSGLKDKELYEALIHAFAKGWLKWEYGNNSGD